MSTNKPHLTLLSLEKEPWLEETYGPLFQSLKAKADVTEITTAHTFSDGPQRSGQLLILATDAALTTNDFRSQLDAAVKRVRDDGATLIFGCVFSSFARPPEIGPCFAAFGLPWESGDYHRTDFSVNNACASLPPEVKDRLVPRYSQKALHLRNVRPEDAVYLPTASSVTLSAVFVPGPVGDRSQTPAAFARVGKGWVGYLGDVNAEEGNEAVVMAMLGLL